MLVPRRIATLATLFLTLPVAAQQRNDLAALRQGADSLVRAYLAAGHAPSAGVAVIRGNDTLLLAGYGVADLEHEVPATAQSVFRIGSVTKQFTAAAVMQLAEQGRLALDDSIATHLGNLPVAWRAVTVRQLLNHTSGIPSYTNQGLRWIRRWGEEMPPDTMFALVADRRMDFAPGSAWNYNNTGYILLGVLIEQLTGRSWGEEIRSRFAEPLGLASLMNCLTAPVIPHRVRGYDKDENRWVNSTYLAMSQPFSAGALCATAGDIAKWNQALHGGRVVSAASYAAMTTPAGAAARSAPRYGFGLIADTLAGRPIITHGGGIHGFNAANIWVPDAKLSVTVLVNSTSGNATVLAQQLVRVAVTSR